MFLTSAVYSDILFSNECSEDGEMYNDRTILHCDANSFFASVETVFHPEYKSVPMAVCGSREDRHGIVLAKNDLAKACGVKTGEVIWQAKQKCPLLVIAEPHYELYTRFSKEMGRIFYDYTDMIEPFGIDESWLDVTASRRYFGDGISIAEKIRSRVKSELGITVSIGVSFNKVFAKLGSDLKKPDAITVIGRDDFRQKLYDLPISDMLFVGAKTKAALSRVGIYTIGDAAECKRQYLVSLLGKTGGQIWDNANGLDMSQVSPGGYSEKAKSVSNGMTFKRNLKTDADISFAVYYLADDVARRLRETGARCRCVTISLRLPDLSRVGKQMTVAPTCLAADIAKHVLCMIPQIHKEGEIYSLTVHTSDLVYGDDMQECLPFFDDDAKKLGDLEYVIDEIRKKYGNSAIKRASGINNDLRANKK